MQWGWVVGTVGCAATLGLAGIMVSDWLVAEEGCPEGDWECMGPIGTYWLLFGEYDIDYQDRHFASSTVAACYALVTFGYLSYERKRTWGGVFAVASWCTFAWLAGFLLLVRHMGTIVVY